MAEGVNEVDVRPAKLKAMTADEVKASAQRILDLRGRPPYTEAAYYPGALTPDELRVLSEFVQFWLPFLIEKEKK